MRDLYRVTFKVSSREAAIAVSVREYLEAEDEQDASEKAHHRVTSRYQNCDALQTKLERGSFVELE